MQKYLVRSFPILIAIVKAWLLIKRVDYRKFILSYSLMQNSDQSFFTEQQSLRLCTKSKCAVNCKCYLREDPLVPGIPVLHSFVED